MNNKSTPKVPRKKITRQMAQEMIGHYLRTNLNAVVTSVTGGSTDQEELTAARNAILAEANRMDPEGVDLDV